MANLKAIRNFNNGKGLDKKKGDTFSCDEITSKSLIDAKFAVKVKESHKDQVKKQ